MRNRNFGAADIHVHDLMIPKNVEWDRNRLAVDDDPDHAVLRREAEARANLRIRRLRGEALGVHGPQGAAHRPATANRPVAPRRHR